MYETVLDHRYGWSKARTTHLICRINLTDSKSKLKILQNKKCKHAEELLIDYLNTMSQSLTRITIYLNNSPCSNKGHDCARAIINFLNKNTHVIIILYVANLYNIRRASCKSEEHYTFVDEADHEANFTGLKNLMEHNRCVVSAFSFPVWSELLNTEHVSELFKLRLLSRYAVISAFQDRSRQDEDVRIRSDLICIRYIPFVIQQQF